MGPSGSIHLTTPAPPYHLHLKALEDQSKNVRVLGVGHDPKGPEKILVGALAHQDSTEELLPQVGHGDALGNEQCWEHP